MSPWYGIHLPLESLEFFLVLAVFIGTLAGVYFIQRYIGDY